MKKILEGANLEEVTMKTVYKQVNSLKVLVCLLSFITGCNIYKELLMHRSLKA